MFNFNDLKNNSVVLTGFQFVEQNPLGFFEFDDTAQKQDFFMYKKEHNEASGKVIIKKNGFIPVKDNNGINKAKEDVFVVTRAKSRPVLIFQDIEFSKQHYNNVFVIPIQTIKEFNEDIINRSSEVYDIYYLPKRMPNGEIWHRVLKLSDARFVHISTLYGSVRENEVKDEEIEEIGIRLSKMINIKKIEKCDECIYNYENYSDMQKKEIELGNGSI
ncbi:hypothetical protein CF087_22515 [Clostridium botulinum]|uniref:hypothetical protein n=1 Tax=Clostridium botulinum TaxID=1491 RepID=UPI001969F472|nr:hypothetical protein [Clostridium botulinum]MBN3371788.1 hypothetical protein [Clostridium botulinum]MBN3376602.1 hypothetical protein [Clostridium botulinum]